jgi:CheY-like chemotaxis protein
MVADDADLSDSKVIVLSSSSETMHEAEALRLGVVAYLYKPAREGLLRKAIQNGLVVRTNRVPKATESGATTPRHFIDVLLAEDNIVNQKVAVKNLERFGCRVTVVGNGALAVDALAERAYDLVLMDVQMPVMDGVDATSAIRQREQTTGAHQTIVAMTAHAMSGDRERLLNSGMDDYISKPFDSATLGLLLSRWHTPDSAAPAPRGKVSQSKLAILDETRIEDTAGDDTEFAAELFARFVEFADEAVILSKSALENGEFQSLAEIAHSIKGSSGSIGAERLQAASLALELAAKARDSHCGGLVCDLSDEYMLLRERLVSVQAA